MESNFKHQKIQIDLMDSIYLLIRDKQPIDITELYYLFRATYKNFNVDESSFEAILDQMCSDQIILKNSEEKLLPNPAKFTFQSYLSNYLVDKRDEKAATKFNKLVVVLPIIFSLLFGIFSCAVSIYSLKVTQDMNDINSKETYYKLIIDSNGNTPKEIGKKDTITIKKTAK